MIYCTDQTVTMLIGVCLTLVLALFLSYHHLRVREGVWRRRLERHLRVREREWRRRLEREKHRQDLRIRELALAADEIKAGGEATRGTDMDYRTREEMAEIARAALQGS